MTPEKRRGDITADELIRKREEMLRSDPEYRAKVDAETSTSLIARGGPAGKRRRAVRHPNFERVFAPGSIYRWTDGTPFEVEVVDAGRLKLGTGSVAATDPAWPSLDDAVAAVVEPGSYPVSLSLARSRSAPDRVLVSAVRMIVSSGEVETWVPAWQRETSTGNMESHGFTVDAGQACLLDQAALPFLIALVEDEEASAALSLRVESQMFEHVVDETSGLNVIVFSCGMGDGTYPVWLGSTREGEVAQVVVDLEFLSHCAGPEDLQ